MTSGSHFEHPYPSGHGTVPLYAGASPRPPWPQPTLSMLAPSPPPNALAPAPSTNNVLTRSDNFSPPSRQPPSRTTRTHSALPITKPPGIRHPHPQRSDADKLPLHVSWGAPGSRPPSPGACITGLACTHRLATEPPSLQSEFSGAH